MLCYVATLQALDSNKKAPARLWAFATGLSLGLVFLIRPLTALGISLPFAFYSLLLLWHTPRTCFPAFLAAVAGGMLCLIFQGWYDLNTTGNIFLLPYTKYHSSGIPGFNNGYTVWTGFLKGQDEWASLNLVLFEWFVPCTLFVMIACLLPLKNRYSRLLLTTILLYSLVNVTNRYSTFMFGPRYIYEISPALIILTAVGTGRLALLLESWRLPLPHKNAVQGMIAFMLILIFAAGWIYRVPAEIKKYSNHFYYNNPEFYASLHAQAKNPALVFIERFPKSEAPNKRDPYTRYLWVAFSNPPSDNARVIFASDLGEDKNRKLIEYYAKRNPYLERNGRLYPIDKKTFESPSPPARKP